MDNYRMIGKDDVTGFLSSFLTFVKNILAYILQAVRQNLVLAAIIFVLVIAGGYYYRHIQKPYYEAEMVCTFSNLGKKTYGEMVHNLDILAKNGSYHSLASILNIQPAQAQDIISIDAKNIAGSPLYEDITPDQSPIYFTVRASDPGIFVPMQKAMLTYLNTASPFRLNRNSMEMETIDKRKKYLSKDMAMADSVIISYSKFLKRTKSVTDTAAGFSNIAALFAYKNQLEEKDIQQDWRIKELKQPVEVLHGFLTPENPSNNTRGILWTIIALALLLPAGVCVIYTLLNDTFKKEEFSEKAADPVV